MKKLALFLVASVMLSSTFLSASCGDDDEDINVDQKMDEWLSDYTLESDDFYNLYEYDETLVYNDGDITPGSIKDKLDYNGTSVEAKAQVLNETNIEKFKSINAIKALEIKNEVDPNDPMLCIKAVVLLKRIQVGQILAMEVNGKKIVAKAVEIDEANKSVHVKGYALFPKE